METYTIYGPKGQKITFPIDASKRTINKAFRSADQSKLWPISGRFNATERAIRRLRRNGYYWDGLEYIYALENEIRFIVNREV